MTSLSIIDFDDPKIGIDLHRTRDIAVKLGFRLRLERRLHPDAFTIAAHGLGEQPSKPFAPMYDLHKHRAGLAIALA